MQNIRTESLPEGVVGQPYSFRLEHNCSPQTDFAFTDIRWQVSGVPPGMALSSGGELSGTPTVDGRYSFDVSLFACGFVGCGPALDSRPLSLVVRPAP